MNINKVNLSYWSDTDLYCLFCGEFIDIPSCLHCEHVLFVESNNMFGWASDDFLFAMGCIDEDTDYQNTLNTALMDHLVLTAGSKFNDYTLYDVHNTYDCARIGLASSFKRIEIKCPLLLKQRG